MLRGADTTSGLVRYGRSFSTHGSSWSVAIDEHRAATSHWRSSATHTLGQVMNKFLWSGVDGRQAVRSAGC